jgi:hypothetical protein
VAAKTVPLARAGEAAMLLGEVLKRPPARKAAQPAPGVRNQAYSRPVKLGRSSPVAQRGEAEVLGPMKVRVS